MTPNPVHALAVWLRARTHLMLTKAPREAPVLLLMVMGLGLIVLLLYALAWQLDLGVIAGGWL